MTDKGPTHEEIQTHIRRAHQARSIYLAGLVSSAFESSRRTLKKPLVIAGTAVAILVCGALVQSDTGPSTRPGVFAAACAVREAALITTAGSRDGQDATAAIAQSGTKLMTARSRCHEGKVDEAVALYDELIRQVASLSNFQAAGQHD